METLIQHDDMAEIATRFKALTSLVPLTAISTRQDYDHAVAALNRMIDAGAAEESHPLAGLLTTLGILIAAYEEQSNPQHKVSAVSIIRFLMEQHGLSQAQLPEIGSQGVVSEVLSGKRELNIRQIKALAKHFDIPSATLLS